MDNNEFENELKKQIETELEKNRLEDVIKLIHSEILTHIEKRKALSNYILNYRANAIEEFRDDEDKVIEYFDHERYVKEEAFRNIDRRIKEMNILLNAPYFGRVDFREVAFSENAENIYIGRFGLSPDNFEDPVVVDWRAPIASIFYAGKLGQAFYKAPVGDIEVDILMKRQFVIKKQELLGMFDSAIDVKDDILQMVLTQSAGDKLKDIIMTIQEEQDNLIRQPRTKTIVIDGVAGSGKTTIALHRIAYLLYNFRQYLQDKVMIFGPNNIFIEYISTVLPSLGESGVKQSTFQKMALDILDIDGVIDFEDYMEKVLQGDLEFIKKLKYKTSREYVKFLDEYLERLDREYFAVQDVYFKDNTVANTKEIADLFFIHYKSMPLFRRSKKIKRILFSKLRDFRDTEFRALQKKFDEIWNSMSEQERNANGNQLIYRHKLNIRELIQEVINTKLKLKWLDNPDVTMLYNDINGNAPLTSDDLAPMLYMKIVLEGLKLKSEIKHVVIDEAQDYSYLQFYVIKALTGCTAMTVVGDSQQRIIPVEAGIDMLSIAEDFSNMEVENFTLNKSYRSTAQIMEYANTLISADRIVPLVRNGKAVVVSEVHSDAALAEALHKDLVELQESGYESIAIICRDIAETYKIGSLVKSQDYVKILDREDKIYTSGIIIIPSYLAKGLEFDAVIVVDLEDGINKEHIDKMRYVMATRALHELKVYKYK